jgi:archaellum component FlaC
MYGRFVMDSVEFDLVVLSQQIEKLAERIANLESFVEEVASDVRPPPTPIWQIGEAS